MPVPLFQVDAFTDRLFAGNPAGVCLLDAPESAEWMRLVAREMNLSETAFAVSGDDGFSLRWFTPVVEVDLCGHATLATAHVLWETGRLAPEVPARFHTRSGLLTARRVGEWIAIDFPRLPFAAGPIPAEVTQALGVEARLTGLFGPKWLIEVESEAAVRAVRPDFVRLRSIPGRGVVVTSAADRASVYDFISRYFAPWVGVDEDPVTGSVHCCLGPFWSERLGKRELLACQASSRGGWLRIKVTDDRVELAGRAVTVLRGELRA